MIQNIKHRPQCNLSQESPKNYNKKNPFIQKNNQIYHLYNFYLYQMFFQEKNGSEFLRTTDKPLRALPNLKNSNYKNWTNPGKINHKVLILFFLIRICRLYNKSYNYVQYRLPSLWQKIHSSGCRKTYTNLRKNKIKSYIQKNKVTILYILTIIIISNLKLQIKWFTF